MGWKAKNLKLKLRFSKIKQALLLSCINLYHYFIKAMRVTETSPFIKGTYTFTVEGVGDE